MPPIEDPRLFALTQAADSTERRVVAYGIVLPDGSAFSVSWPAGSGASFSSSGSAEHCAVLRDADLLWLAEQAQE